MCKFPLRWTTALRSYELHSMFRATASSLTPAGRQLYLRSPPISSSPPLFILPATPLVSVVIIWEGAPSLQSSTLGAFLCPSHTRVGSLAQSTFTLNLPAANCWPPRFAPLGSYSETRLSLIRSWPSQPATQSQLFCQLCPSIPRFWGVQVMILRIPLSAISQSIRPIFPNLITWSLHTPGSLLPELSALYLEALSSVYSAQPQPSLWGDWLRVSLLPRHVVCTLLFALNMHYLHSVLCIGLPRLHLSQNPSTREAWIPSEAIQASLGHIYPMPTPS